MRARICVAVVAVASLYACLPLADDENNNNSNNNNNGSTTTSCGTLNVTWASAPRFVFAWPEGDTYGVNAFYVWEVDVSGAAPDQAFTWPDSGAAITGVLPAEDWQIPTTLWSAVRFSLDGYDPYHFDVSDQFVMGYVPTTPGGTWTAKTNAVNDGTCPSSNTLVNGWDRCVGDKQQDPAAPKTLTDGSAYLLMMGMVIPLGTDSAGHKLNRVQSCYMNAFVATGTGPQGTP